MITIIKTNYLVLKYVNSINYTTELYTYVTYYRYNLINYIISGINR